ncbi:invasion associated locus B family protein [Palleronia caenipelagi]|uniref:Invasion associated locus B family protein n=1 Tax=Palleronia caenipelagi TaxID=2489174 RepID=A0A547QAM9_9RHOB|nr:invasion associated locus B family protein [Palleronia caenipelagi]TRD23448.1 invasion associated locus B family protein [Palleronia caenipelagi]
MSDLLKSLSLAAVIAMAGPAIAQDAGNADAPAENAAETAAPAGDVATPPLNMGEPVDGPQSPERPGLTVTEFGDWEQRCVDDAPEGAPRCQLYQLLADEQNNPVAEMTILPLPAGSQAAAGATIITPLETLLTRSVVLSVDGGAAKRYPFEFCAPQGCFSRIGLTGDEIAQLKRGASGQMVIVPAAAPDRQITLKIGLSGFTAGFDATADANAAQ